MSNSTPSPLGDWGEGRAPQSGDATEIASGVVRVTAPNPSMMTGPGTNTYLVGQENLIVIDPGPNDPTHCERLLEVINGRSVSGVVVTHTHIDHAPGANLLASALGSQCGGFRSDSEFVADFFLSDGDVIGEDPFEIRVIHTPGHASNHLCFLLESEGLLFTGDHIMEGSTVVIRPPDGSLHQYLENLDRLKAMSPPIRSLAPGHGRVVVDPIGIIEDIEHHRADRHLVVRDALITVGNASPEQLVEVVYPDLEENRRIVATFMLWAHLQYLVFQGNAFVEPGDQTISTIFSVSPYP